MDAVLLLFAVLYLLFGAFIAKSSLSIITLPRFCATITKSALMKPEFKPFLRLNDSVVQIPSRMEICFRAMIFGPLRWLAVVLLVLMAGLSTFVCDKDRVAACTRFVARGLLLSLGVTVKYVGRRAAVTEAACLVSNHVSALDMLALAAEGGAFVGKSAARDIPCIGRVCECIGCIFVARDSVESRSAAKQAIVERLKKSGESQLVIFPEGTTTNGRGLLQFRRGAFEACVPVQPVRIEYSNLECSMTLLGTVDLISYLSAWPRSEMTLHYLPVVKCDQKSSPDETAEKCRNAIAFAKGVYSPIPLELFACGSDRDEHLLMSYINKKP